MSARALDEPFALGRAYAGLGVAWNLTGEPERAAAAYAEAVPWLRAAGQTVWAALSMSNLGEMQLLRGDVARAISLFDEALAEHRRAAYPVGIAMALGQHAHAALLLDDVPLAARLFTESIQAAQTMDAGRLVLGAVTGLAGVALAMGQAERAARLLGAVQAAQVTSGLGQPAHALHGERIAAAVREHLGEPAFAAAFTSGQQTPFAEALEGALALASPDGSVPSGRKAGTSGRLSPRELEVLRLLVEGRSDKEIGAVLFIGSRTVQTHVAHIFAKLGVNARAEAAAVAVRRGLV